MTRSSGPDGPVPTAEPDPGEPGASGPDPAAPPAAPSPPGTAAIADGTITDGTITDGTAGRANPLDDSAFVAGLRPIPRGRVTESEQRAAADLTGLGPDGRPLDVRIGGHSGPLLLCFLQTHCDGCEEFWHRAGDPPGSDWPDPLAVVVVTRGPDSVDRSEVVRLASGVGAVPVVMSDRAWTDYRVTGYPFFVLVDPVLGTVVGETVGFGWADVEAMVRASTDGR